MPNSELILELNRNFKFVSRIWSINFI